MGTSATSSVSSEFHPSETASLFHQSSPFALCLAFGAGMCVSSKRAGITRVFLLLFFLFAMPRGMQDLHSPVLQTRDEPRPAAVEVWSLNHWTAREVLFFILQCGRPGFDPWVEAIPWKRERLPTPVFWPGEFPGLHGVTKNRTQLSDIHFLSQYLSI